jgi:hypothetical protein
MMADYRWLVDQIRTALISGAPGHNGHLARLATDYAEACDEAAQRLGRCHGLLQQGLRSEAIQLAEADPKLLDALAVLDFPERSDWDDLVQWRGLTPAPRLPLEAARMLKAANANEHPLRDLLERHRRLALMRAPLRLRIAVLRQLAARDPKNPIWSEDLRAFERARMQQIRDEAIEAIRRHDAEWTRRLVWEAELPDWTDRPRALALALRKADDRIRITRARIMLKDVASRLDEARNARDPLRGRIEREEWSRLAADAALAPDDPIADRAQRALDWLDDQDRRDRENREHEDAVRALERTLDDPGRVASAELKRLAHAVHARPDGLPERLRPIYITRLREAEVAEGRRRRLIAAASAAGLILAGTLIYGAAHTYVRGREAVQFATRISDMLELDEVEQAVALVKHLESSDPGLWKYAAMIEVRARVQSDWSKEQARQLDFERSLKEAARAPLRPDPPPAMLRARAMARRPTDKEEVARVTRIRDTAIREETTRRHREHSGQLDTIAKALDQIEARLKPGGPGRPADPAVLGPIADAQGALSRLLHDEPMVDAGIRERAQALSERLDELRSQKERLALRARLEDAITDAVAYTPGDRGVAKPGELADALQASVKAFPNSPRSRAFADTLRDQAVWDAIAEWSRMTADWRADALGVAPPEATIRAMQCRQFAVRHPASPDLDRTTAYGQAMEAMARRSADGEGALGKLQKLMTDPLIDNVWMVTVRVPASITGRRRYYVAGKPSSRGGTLSYMIDRNGTKRSIRVAGDWIESIVVSPQTRVAQRFRRKLLLEPTGIDWEVDLLDLMTQVRTESGMDSVLQVWLLKKVLDSSLQGSDPLQKALARLKDQVDQAGVNVDACWMDPACREANQARPGALACLLSLPDMGAFRQDALARRAAIGRLLTGHPTAIGWLAHEPGEGWRIRTGGGLPQEGELYIALASDEGRGRWKKIGVIAKGRPQLLAPGDAALAEGRPVFVVAAGQGG